MGVGKVLETPQASHLPYSQKQGFSATPSTQTAMFFGQVQLLTNIQLLYTMKLARKV